MELTTQSDLLCLLASFDTVNINMSTLWDIFLFLCSIQTTLYLMRSLIIQSQLTIDRSVTIFTFSRSATAGAAEALREAAALGLSWSEGPRPLHLAAAPAGAGVLAVLASSR